MSAEPVADGARAGEVVGGAGRDDRATPIANGDAPSAGASRPR